MTSKAIAEHLGAEIIAMPFPERAPQTAYCGDLLSWVMGHADPKSVWVTIMTNKNVLAVASLLELPLVIVCENAEIDGDFAAAALEQGINVVRCKSDCYTVCTALHGILK